MKKVLSIIMAAAIVLSTFAGLSISANAVSATPIQFGETINSTIEYYKEKNYSFTISSKGEVELNIVKYVSRSFTIYLYDEKMNEICKFSDNFDYNKLTEKYTYNRVVALMPGKYYLQLVNHSKSISYEMTLNFNPSTAKQTTFRIPNSSISAYQIEKGETVNSSIQYFNNQNYVFSINYKGTVTIDITKKVSRSFSAYIYDENFNQLCKLFSYYLTPGVYYIHLENHSLEIQYRIGLSYQPSIVAPTGLKCTARTTAAEKVQWNAVSGVTGYQIQRSNGATQWTAYANVKSTSYVFTQLRSGAKYKFRVRAYKTIDGKNYFSKWSTTLNSATKPATVNLKTTTSPAKRQIRSTWNSVGGVCTGYQIAYYRNSNGTSLACVKYANGQSKNSFTLTNAASGRIFYVKVRAYTNFGGVNYWGAWSRLIKVKVR